MSQTRRDSILYTEYFDLPSFSLHQPINGPMESFEDTRKQVKVSSLIVNKSAIQ